jgi:hypothetical protein
VPSIVGRDRLDHKAITPISVARAPALVLVVIAVLSGTPRGIELCECRCIFPEFVWRLQWLPCDDIAVVVQLQANYLKHEAVLSLAPEMTRLADLQHLACSRKFASLTALRLRPRFETARPRGHLTFESRSSFERAELRLLLVRRVAPVSIRAATGSPLEAASAVLMPS